MNELQAQLQEVTDQLAQLDPNNRDNLIEIASLKARQTELTSKAAMEDEQQAAAQVKIETETQEISSFLDSLEIEGLKMRDLTAGENEYQMLRIAVETKLIEQSVKAASEVKLINLQHQEDLRAAAVTINQLELEVKHANSQRDAAVAKADGLELLVSEKQEQIDLLRTENSIGAIAATQVIDQTAQLKAIADKIKASRIHVYDVVPDADFNPKNFTAKRADTGEQVTYNWTQARNYIELKDAAEVERFRLEHAEQNTVPDPTLDHAIEIQPIAEVTAPEVQFPDQGEVSTVPTPVESGNANQGREDAETVSREEFEALKATVKELCEVCNIAEVA